MMPSLMPLRRAALVAGALLLLGAMPAAAMMDQDSDKTCSDKGADHTAKKDCGGELAAVKALVDHGDFAAAFRRLDALRAEAPDSAAVLTARGYAFRKEGHYPDAKSLYDAALAREPHNTATLEYQGEWYAETGDIGRARANLVTLARLCGNCEEHADLAEAIESAAAR